jgi:hypothetical protein
LRVPEPWTTIIPHRDRWIAEISAFPNVRTLTIPKKSNPGRKSDA